MIKELIQRLEQIGVVSDDSQEFDAELTREQAIDCLVQLDKIRKIVDEYREDRWTDEVDPYLKRIIEVIEE